MISRAITSGRNHGINLKHGTPNPGAGDCAFEAIIQNVNDRPCFTEKFRNTIDWYRRIWAKDMENRTIDSPYNIYGHKKWQEGWKEMQNPGIYERGIFGDLMLQGIACGVRKYLLIFNTNVNTPHDLIYIVNPSTFNIRPDTEIPVVLAYNMSHYESMEPCTDIDTQSTVALVKEYLEGRYRYSRKDIHHLIGTQNDKHIMQETNEVGKKINGRKKPLEEDEGWKTIGESTLDNVTSNNICPEIGSSEKEIGPYAKNNGIEVTRKNLKNKEDTHNLLLGNDIKNICYKTKNSDIIHNMTEIEGKIECPFCNEKWKNLNLHFTRRSECRSKIDMEHFSQQYEAYKNSMERKRKREKDKKYKAKLKAVDIESFKRQNIKAVEKSQQKKKDDNQELFKRKHNEAAKKYLKKKKDDNQELFKRKQNEAANKYRKKIKANVNDRGRIYNFKRAVLFGPIFICSCCKRRLFENSVTKITDGLRTKINEKRKGLYKICIRREVPVKFMVNGKEETEHYICGTCKDTLLTGKIPSMAEINGLELVPIDENCYLTEFENNLIALNLIFQYIFFLKKSRWAATKKQMISVPIAEKAMLETIEHLPRLPKEAGLVSVQIKKKKEYRSCHKKEFIDPEKLIKALIYLQKSGHPYYQFLTENIHSYKKRCEEQDQEGHELLFGLDHPEETDESRANKCEDELFHDIEEDDMMKDTRKKFQFDHNRNTCMTHNFPEAAVDESGKKKMPENEFSFAPGEGSYPTNILTEKDWDIKSWPILHPDGRFGIHYKRKTRLTEQQYFGQRIINQDMRFAKSPGYIFAAAAFIEKKQLMSKANISFMRGRKSLNNEGKAQYDLDDAFTTFDGVKNTPKYWQRVKYDMIAKLENIGPFHFFFTLSCGDTRYNENFSTFLTQNDYTINYIFNGDTFQIETFVEALKGRKIKKKLEIFLQEDVNESLHEMIRSNVLTATRTFQHRVEMFKKEIMMGSNNPMKIKYISYRVEFQGRGAAHIHGILWLDMKTIEKLPIFKDKDNKTDSGYLSEAFRKFRDDEKLSEKEKDAIANFTDMFISCSLNPNTIHEDPEVGQRIIDIIKKVNCHNCTNPCQNYGDTCKYGFPRFPLKETMVVDKKDIMIEPQSCHEQREDAKKNHLKILSDVENILTDPDKIEEIMGKFEKGKSEVEYAENRAKRIDLLLEMAGNVSYEDYINAIKKNVKHGSTVLLKRDIDEIRVNNFNPEWAEAWDANHDIQIVLDYFAAITYITDYWAKPDEGITKELREAAALLKSEPDQQKRCQQMANIFMSHRQMSESEAYYKIFPHLNLKYSNVDTIFIPSDKKEHRSKFLLKLPEEENNSAKGLEVKGGREGKFLEKPDIIDKFCRRKITEKHPELAAMPSLHFAKMFEPVRGRNKKENVIEESSDEEEDSQNTDNNFDSNNTPWKDEEDRVANFYITTEEKYNHLRLPNYIQINDCQPGEVPLWKKKTFPKAARIHKKKEDTDPHRFFLSELMLYKGFTDEEELGANDEQKCMSLYIENKEAIQFVKSKLMPFAQGVEEARLIVEQANEEINNKKMGDILDSEMEQEIQECNEGEEEPHPDFQLNPDEIDNDDQLKQIRKTFRQIQLRSADERLEETRNLDQYQKSALHVALNFAMDILISRKGKIPYPRAPHMIIHGGAGSGKSTLIHAISQQVNSILRREGDDPDCPYVVLSAYTGTAAANIEGQTLHTLFSFNFGAGYMSLSDKMRDEKRILYKNLKMLIIDEISLVDADMFYKIDMRLRELTQIDLPFGNVAIFVLGDLMQMRPITGRYIFCEPRDSQFSLVNDIDPLWKKFQCINLEINHRQGKDKEYAETLNRIRIGKETLEDIKILKERVRKADHKDITKSSDALFIYGTNKKVNAMNNKRLKSLKGNEFIIEAISIHKTIKSFNPAEGKAGEVLKTPFQKELRIKIGAKIMLTYNIDTCDGLTNGARGEIIGLIFDRKETISRIVIKFEKESVGRDKRMTSPELQKKYPGGTPIEKVKFSFSISKSKKSIINTAMVIQFPIKLAFACTAHKIQGSTISKPQKAVINTNDSFGAAMIYVMLSRVCSLSQIYILDEFDESKMYPDFKALAELETLNNISQNRNKTEWEDGTGGLRIYSLNCRSLKKHYKDIASDEVLLKSDIILLQETWLEDDSPMQMLEIPGYALHFNSQGRGKGLATYFKSSIFSHEIDVKQDDMQLSKFTSKNIDIISIYRSKQGTINKLNEEISAISRGTKALLMVGDFNYCYLEKAMNSARKFLTENDFSQLIFEPTHLEGNILDHCYLRDRKTFFKATVQLHCKYYTDHKGLAVLLKRKDR